VHHTTAQADKLYETETKTKQVHFHFCRPKSMCITRALSITFTVHTETRQGTATAALSIHTSSQHHTSSQFTHSQFTQSQEVKQRTRGAYLADVAEEQQGMAGARRWRPGGGGEASMKARRRRGADVLVQRRPWSRRWRRGAGPAATLVPTADARHRSGGGEALVAGALFV
jgi:hypothetical protein